MTAFWKNVLAVVVATGICANTAMMFSFGERLARIEAQLETFKTVNQIAQNEQNNR